MRRMIWLMRIVRNTSPLSEVKVEIDRLRAECRFFISRKVEELILQRVGEG
jgi:hypothetical protein